MSSSPRSAWSTHWDAVYRNRSASERSWFQKQPAVSVELLLGEGFTPASLIDVGAGESSVVDHVLATGVDHVTVVDISDDALQPTRVRVGHDPRVQLTVADITTWTPLRRFDAWHDRATFHFLTDPADVERYVRAAAAAVEPGGRAVIGTFSDDGPDSCSGLPVTRYTANDLHAVFSEYFNLYHTRNETHLTPSGAEQHFVWVVMTRR